MAQCKMVLVNVALKDGLRNVHILGSHSDRNACHEATVEVPKLVARLLSAVYILRTHSGREDEVKGTWEEFGYRKLSSETLGITSLDEVWYAVFRKNPSCQYASAPETVIAVRGTANTVDLKSNLRLMAQALGGDCRYGQLMKVAEGAIEMFGHKNVSIAGHSLGAALVLHVAKALLKDHKPLETYLYNPPFPSFDIFSSKSLRQLEKSGKAMLLAMHTLLSTVSLGNHDQLVLIRKDYEEMGKCKWTPHLFLNRGDFVNQGFINQIIDRETLSDNGFKARIHKWVGPYTLSSLINSESHPTHLLGSVNFTIADSLANPLESHGVEQWGTDPEWKSGNEVGGVKFGRQLFRRAYNMRREYITIGDSDVKVMAYCQTQGASALQATVCTVSLGLATTKQIQVIFLFNTDQDANTAERLWPEGLMCCHINTYVAQAKSFEFQLQIFYKGAVTFYVYAVRSSKVPFEREIEWRALKREIHIMGDVTNWIHWIRTMQGIILVAGVVLGRT